jgi:FecR-like protein
MGWPATTRRCAALLILLAAAFAPAAVAAQPADLPATVSTLAGRSEVLPAGASTWIPAKLLPPDRSTSPDPSKERLGSEVDAGASARVPGAGRMALRTPSGHALRIGSFSQIQLVGAAAAGAEEPLRVKLLAGRLWVAVSPVAGPRPRVAVDAGPVTVSVRGSGVSLRMDRDGSVLVRVYHGAAVAAGTAGGATWERPLKGGEELVVPATGAPGPPRALSRESHEEIWVRWNEEQDAAGYGGPMPPR